MRQIVSCIIFLLLTSTTSIVLCQITDSVQVTTSSIDTSGNLPTVDYHDEVEDDFAPALILFALFGVGFMFIGIGVGIVLAVIGLLILFGLITAGLLSASILVGLYNKSFEKGFRTFIVSVTAAGGLFMGATGFWLLNKIMHWFPTQTALITGSISGLLTGLLLGFALYYILKKLTAFLRNKLNAI